jgi:ATP-binding protein involved in chromosome partitioning
MRITGVVENMSMLSCPHCGEKISIFGSGGGARMADQMEVRFLGEIPVESEMVEMGDKGSLETLTREAGLEINNAYERILEIIIKGE